MLIIQVRESKTLLDKARTTGQRIDVAVLHTLALAPAVDAKDGARHPALLFDYAVLFKNAEGRDETWTFKELAFANEKGEVDLDKTFLRTLSRQSAVEYRVTRGGAI